MSMQIEGTVLSKTPVITIGENKLLKQSLHVEEVGQEYPQSLLIDFLGDWVAKLEKINTGDIVSVSFNTRVTDYNGKQYNNIRWWKVAKIENNPIDGDEVI